MILKHRTGSEGLSLLVHQKPAMMVPVVNVEFVVEIRQNQFNGATFHENKVVSNYSKLVYSKL
jgi:hypothetical protein